jgi:hypothetical protein
MDANQLEGYKEGPYNQDLKNAIRWLKGQGIIDKDKDIVEKTGYGKSTVSGYAKGRIEASPDFRTKFEEVFKLQLKSFQNFHIIDSNMVQEPIVEYKTKSVQDKYVELLEKTLNEKEADLKTFRSAIEKITQVDSSVTELKSTVNGLSKKVEDLNTIVPALREFVFDELSKLTKKSPEYLGAALGRKQVAILKQNQKTGTRNDLGS